MLSHAAAASIDEESSPEVAQEILRAAKQEACHKICRLQTEPLLSVPVVHSVNFQKLVHNTLDQLVATGQLSIDHLSGYLGAQLDPEVDGVLRQMASGFAAAVSAGRPHKRKSDLGRRFSELYAGVRNWLSGQVSENQAVSTFTRGVENLPEDFGVSSRDAVAATSEGGNGVYYVTKLTDDLGWIIRDMTEKNLQRATLLNLRETPEAFPWGAGFEFVSMAPPYSELRRPSAPPRSGDAGLSRSSTFESQINGTPHAPPLGACDHSPSVSPSHLFRDTHAPAQLMGSNGAASASASASSSFGGGGGMSQVTREVPNQQNGFSHVYANGMHPGERVWGTGVGVGGGMFASPGGMGGGAGGIPGDAPTLFPSAPVSSPSTSSVFPPQRAAPLAPPPPPPHLVPVPRSGDVSSSSMPSGPGAVSLGHISSGGRGALQPSSTVPLSIPHFSAEGAQGAAGGLLKLDEECKEGKAGGRGGGTNCDSQVTRVTSSGSSQANCSKAMGAMSPGPPKMGGTGGTVKTEVGGGHPFKHLRMALSSVSFLWDGEGALIEDSMKDIQKNPKITLPNTHVFELYMTRATTTDHEAENPSLSGLTPMEREVSLQEASRQAEEAGFPYPRMVVAQLTRRNPQVKFLVNKKAEVERISEENAKLAQMIRDLKSEHEQYNLSIPHLNPSPEAAQTQARSIREPPVPSEDFKSLGAPAPSDPSPADIPDVPAYADGVQEDEQEPAAAATNSRKAGQGRGRQPAERGGRGRTAASQRRPIGHWVANAKFNEEAERSLALEHEQAVQMREGAHPPSAPPPETHDDSRTHASSSSSSSSSAAAAAATSAASSAAVTACPQRQQKSPQGTAASRAHKKRRTGGDNSVVQPTSAGGHPSSSSSRDPGVQAQAQGRGMMTRGRSARAATLKED
uniref:Uncharacterized protein n=1 Tax=Chromera velia CCMP2878 TaxID=1169474 RepID=A0A0G4GZ06_9ALVE|eukprot:Cvel_5427.t1-p1 / transcript=Cvel_5427.t1 / gene=Cvel_5427 / organism=Chromera_velia_CCMP2878 / gene_product=hypothetical protein / transcript_product=hypothetical protein / location=Cvel_scaffold252:100638-105662(-) / protein_length=909 / sequence_SO=supercontig / SO=protein_coding / is_pseudo=false